MMNQYQEEVECEWCGNVWDGYAQCVCNMLEELNIDESVESDNEEDIMSISSDGSTLFEDFEETGHIPMETTRESIKEMLIIARSQEETDEVPEWINETRDYLTRGDFIDGKYYISAYAVSEEAASLPFKKMAQTLYPALTDEECDDFSNQLDAGVAVDDIIDGFNIKRMREYDNKRVFQLHWPQWASGEVPTLELVKMRGV